MIKLVENKRTELKNMADAFNQTLTPYEEGLVERILSVCETQAERGRYEAEFSVLFKRAPFKTLIAKLENALQQRPYNLTVKEIGVKTLGADLHKFYIVLNWGE